MFFKRMESSLKEIQHEGIKYIAEPSFLDKFYNNSFDMLSKDLVPLDVAEEYRAVLLSKKLNVVIKHNALKGVRRRLYAHFGLQNISGKYSLIDEFINLKALSHIEFIPKVYAFGRCNKFPMEREVLIIEYFENALTADEAVLKYPENKYKIIKSVFDLFLRAWDNGFAHMDPHPKNILFLDENILKFIDFECCCLYPEDKEFYMGFSMGYFFHFWFNKYFEDKDYTEHVYSFVLRECPELDMKTFGMYYEKFKNDKVSRSLRYKCFKSAREREKLIK